MTDTNYANIRNITELSHARVRAGAEVKVREKALKDSFQKVRDSFTFTNVSLAVSRRIFGTFSMTTIVLKGISMIREWLSDGYKEDDNTKDTINNRETRKSNEN